jgi:hypothetical protein
MQVARELAEKAAGLPSSVAEPALAVTPPTATKPPSVISPFLSQTAVAVPAPTTPTPTAPVASAVPPAVLKSL